MAALDDATVTLDTNEMVFTDRHGLEYTVSNSETFVFELIARGTQVVYRVKTDSLALDTGDRLEINTDQNFSEFTVDADGTVKNDAGSIWIREPRGERNMEWKLRSINIDNIDEPTLITSAVFERRNSPIHSMTLTNITVAQ